MESQLNITPLFTLYIRWSTHSHGAHDASGCGSGRHLARAPVIRLFFNRCRSFDTEIALEGLKWIRTCWLGIARSAWPGIWVMGEATKLPIDIYPEPTNTTYYVLSGHKIRKKYGYWYIILLYEARYEPESSRHARQAGEQKKEHNISWPDLGHVIWIWKYFPNIFQELPFKMATIFRLFSTAGTYL